MQTDLLLTTPLPVLLGLAVLAVAGVVATVRAIARDGYGRTRPPRSHEADEFAGGIGAARGE